MSTDPQLPDIRFDTARFSDRDESERRNIRLLRDAVHDSGIDVCERADAAKVVELFVARCARLNIRRITVVRVVIDGCVVIAGTRRELCAITRRIGKDRLDVLRAKEIVRRTRRRQTVEVVMLDVIEKRQIVRSATKENIRAIRIRRLRIT